MDQFERFEFKPWIGTVAGVALIAVAWDSNSDLAIVIRGLGMTVFFGAGTWSYRRRRQSSTSRASIYEIKSLVFAGVCALLTLTFLVAWVIDRLHGN